MKRVYVRLHVPEIEAIMKLSEANRRHPCDEAAVLIRQQLDAMGLLAAPQPKKPGGWVLTHEGMERVAP